ncbi:MAG: DedA family protein [Gammaproteobacteria bacterium]|nr:DedA family protein [Gammaproteobacteria bacterium]MDH5276672.1 DedA family protein [Gammaproteobacteria bacterium]
MLDLILQFVDIVLHLNVHLDTLVADYGAWVYAILFLIIFCETGLVVTPFLPGDSLLFAAGAIAASGRLDIFLLCGLLIVAAISGNAVNYWVGRLAGQEMQRRFPRLIRQEHLDRTHAYFERYGGKTVIIARFVPIIRTVAPFAAGAGQMTHVRYQFYNVTGSLLWVLLLVPAGYFFANVPIVQRNFSAVIIGIIVISVLPGVVEYLRARTRVAQ